MVFKDILKMIQENIKYKINMIFTCYNDILYREYIKETLKKIKPSFFDHVVKILPSVKLLLFRINA